jgi:hypothetical protein
MSGEVRSIAVTASAAQTCSEKTVVGGARLVDSALTMSL